MAVIRVVTDILTITAVTECIQIASEVSAIIITAEYVGD